MHRSMESEGRPIRPRTPPVSFDEPIPHHWFGGVGAATHLVNGVNLLFPAGERFFVRSVRRYLDRINDPGLRDRVKGFFGQEGRHAQAHERFFEILEAQGYEIRPFLAIYEKISFDWLENAFSPEMRLSVTVALEHFTAILARGALTDRLLDHAHPEVRRLLFWHAAEEIEHKSVAFDVLRAVDPSYGLRMRGLALASVAFAAFWVAAVATLIAQDRKLGRVGAIGQWRRLPKRPPIAKRVFWDGIKEYVGRDFHPSQHDDLHLAVDYLTSIGLA